MSDVHKYEAMPVGLVKQKDGDRDEYEGYDIEGQKAKEKGEIDSMLSEFPNFIFKK